MSFLYCIWAKKGSWGFNRRAGIHEYESAKDLIHLLIETVAFNGNLLLNVGPSADGTISPIFQDRLLEIGNWLKINGEAIYKTKPWSVCQNETSPHNDLFYTTKGKTLYAILRQWPDDNKLRLTCPVTTAETKARMLGLDSEKENVLWSVPSTLLASNKSTQKEEERQLRQIADHNGLELDLPALNPATTPSHYAWVVALTGLANV